MTKNRVASASTATPVRRPWWDTVTNMTDEQAAQYAGAFRTREEKIAEEHLTFDSVADAVAAIVSAR